MPLPITKQRKLFCLLVHYGIHILSHYPSWHAPSSSNSFFPLLGGAGHFPQKSLSGNPKIGSPFSPPPDHTFSYLWPMAHHSCTGWVQVGGAWALCVFHFCVCLKLVCYSCICHGLEAHLFIMSLILDLLCVNCFLIFHSLRLASFKGWVLLDCEFFSL